jgi:hypothetical protein
MARFTPRCTVDSPSTFEPRTILSASPGTWVSLRWDACTSALVLLDRNLFDALPPADAAAQPHGRALLRRAIPRNLCGQLCRGTGVDTTRLINAGYRPSPHSASRRPLARRTGWAIADCSTASEAQISTWRRARVMAV